MKTILFSTPYWNYHSDGTFGQNSKWKTENGLVYWWDIIEKKWHLDYHNVQMAYQAYIVNLISRWW